MSINVTEVTKGVCSTGKHSGFPCTFIYLREGDEKYSRRSIENMIKAIRRSGNEYVHILGGEPLLQGETMALVYEVSELGIAVSVHTYGEVEIYDDRTKRGFSYLLHLSVPSMSSGKHELENLENLRRLSSIDEVKVPIACKDDFKYLQGVLRRFPTRATIILNPVGDVHLINDLKEWARDSNLINLKVEVDGFLHVREGEMLHEF